MKRKMNEMNNVSKTAVMLLKSWPYSSFCSSICPKIYVAKCVLANNIKK